MWRGPQSSDLGHQIVREAQVRESLLQDLGGVLRLAAITCEALLRMQVTALSGFGVAFLIGCGLPVMVCFSESCLCRVACLAGAWDRRQAPQEPGAVWALPG